MIKLSILARDLGIHRNTLYVWHKEGKLRVCQSQWINLCNS